MSRRRLSFRAWRSSRQHTNGGLSTGEKAPKKCLNSCADGACYGQWMIPRADHRTAIAAATAWLTAITIAACGGSAAVLNQQAEAHRLSADLRVQFARASDASNRAVMADTDEASRGAAHEAGQATQSVQRDTGTLRTVLQDLGD